MRSLWSSRVWIWMVLACGLVSGCRPSEIRLRLRSEARANEGRSVVLLVRTVAGAEPYRRDRYSDIERLVITPDASVLRVLSLPPGLGTPQTFRIPYPPQGGLALYALYGTAMADWRVLFLAPVPDRIDLTLGAEGIDRSQTREHRPLRLPRLPELPGAAAPTGPAAPTGGVPNATPPALPSMPAAKPAGGTPP